MTPSDPSRRTPRPGGVPASTDTDRPHRKSARPEPFRKPPLRQQNTTLWEYPSQHYGDAIQGDKNYVGATPSWVIWQLLTRYTREKDLIVDPMCGSGTTLDVARDLGRRALGYDLSPYKGREDIFRADARRLPVEDEKADFVFVDPPYSTHVDYSDDPRCIGKLDAGGADAGAQYFQAMEKVIGEIHRILRPGRFMALYVSDSFKKGRKEGAPFMPIGFELFALLRKRFVPADIVCVVRHNANLKRGNWLKAAEEGAFMLRGFNYLFIMKKPARDEAVRASRPEKKTRTPAPPAAPPRPRRRPEGDR